MALNSRESRRDELERELAERIDVKNLVEGELFQKYFATPFYQELKKLKTAYNCENMYDLKHTQGRYLGLKALTDIVNENESKIKFIRNDLSKI